MNLICLLISLCFVQLKVTAAGMPAEAMFDFVYDAQTLLTSVLGVLEFIIGISYVAGKYLTEGIVDVATVLWGFSKDVGAAMEFSLQLLVEVSQQLLQTAFLIYYAIGHIVDGKKE